jgi:hypothetical protein
MNKFSNKNKNWLAIFIILLIAELFFAYSAQAGTLSCTVRSTACLGGETEIYEMQSTTDSHAGLPAASYTNLVCCGGVTGLGNSCSGTHAIALKLSGMTDAHARQGTLADYPSATDACISVATGGSVSVGYQPTNCAGFDTMLGTMIGTTNSHVGDSSWANGSTKICASAHEAGSLSVDIVDATGTPVASPAIAINSTASSFSFQTVTGTFGTSAQRVRVSNTTLDVLWTASIAAASGPTALLAAGTQKYDFNDPTAGAADGPDTDIYGGQMTLNPSIGTLAGTCPATGVTKGSSAAFSEGVTDSITLLTAGATANTDCYWDFTGVGVSQTIPPEQTAGNYAINMTLSVVAN